MKGFKYETLRESKPLSLKYLPLGQSLGVNFHVMLQYMLVHPNYRVKESDRFVYNVNLKMKQDFLSLIV